jgi:hypothetical protein
MDVMAHYGCRGRPWEVCVRVVKPPFQTELGCYSPQSEDGVGGHLVTLVEDAFLVDASLGQITDGNPHLLVPPVFVGELMPPGGPLRTAYQFSTPSAELHYEARPMSRDYRLSLDWGPSPERATAATSIIAKIDAYCRVQGIE